MKRMDRHRTFRQGKGRWAVFLTVVMLLCASVSGLYAARDKELFDKARLALWDRDWDKALEQLNRLTASHPGSAYYAQALFYKGKCYKEKKMPGKALESYRSFLKESRNDSLKEEATVSIIDLNFELVEQGQKQHMKNILAYLDSPEVTIRYFAAFKLSYAKDKRAAAKAVPILKSLVENESDKELVDRARIALLRIDPEYLEKSSKVSGRNNDPDVKKLSIEVYSLDEKKISFKITIPFMLARVAMDALPPEQKKLLKKEGYDFDKIIREVLQKGNRVQVKVDETIFKVWIH